MRGRVYWAFLALPAALSVGDLKRLAPDDFVSAEVCKSCHTEIYQQWRSSFHSQAATDPVFWRLFQKAARDSDRKLWALCLTCHAPVATVATEISPVRPVSLPVQLSTIAREGVTCDFCHTISGNENLGKNVSLGAYRFPHRGDTKIRYGTHADASCSAARSQPSAFLQSAQLCAICHQYTHPLPGLELQNTYAEWYYGSQRTQSRRCQDCHMPAYAGRSANDGPERSDISAHVFQGGHTQMLKKAAVVSLWGRVAEKAGTKRLSVSALVTNVGSGHLMPTGIPGIRELWLEFTVREQQGTEIYARRVNFGAELVDRDGAPALPWTAVRVASDTRIAPQRSRKQTFDFTVPNSNFGVLEARALLYYRLISESAAKLAGIEPSPQIEVARDQLLISSEGWVKRVPVQ